jgi:hypothetical protein
MTSLWRIDNPAFKSCARMSQTNRAPDEHLGRNHHRMFAFHLLHFCALFYSQFHQPNQFNANTTQDQHELFRTLPTFRTIPVPSCQGPGRTVAPNASQTRPSQPAKQEWEQEEELCDEANTIEQSFNSFRFKALRRRGDWVTIRLSETEWKQKHAWWSIMSWLLTAV